MKYAEIGEVLGISDNAVKQRAFQAMRKAAALPVGPRGVAEQAMKKDDPTLCHEIHVQLPALVAEELDAEARAAIEQHLAYCPGCQFEWRAYELVWRCLAECEDVEPPEELRHRVFAAIDEHERTVAKR